jgi:hypothetical protein
MPEARFHSPADDVIRSSHLMDKEPEAAQALLRETHATMVSSFHMGPAQFLILQ